MRAVKLIWFDYLEQVFIVYEIVLEITNVDDTKMMMNKRTKLKLNYLLKYKELLEPVNSAFKFFHVEPTEET